VGGGTIMLKARNKNVYTYIKKLIDFIAIKRMLSYGNKRKLIQNKKPANNKKLSHGVFACGIEEGGGYGTD